MKNEPHWSRIVLLIYIKGLNFHLVGNFFSLSNINFTLCTGYLGQYSLSKFCISGAAMEEIYPFNEHYKTTSCTTTFIYIP